MDLYYFESTSIALSRIAYIDLIIIKLNRLYERIF